MKKLIESVMLATTFLLVIGCDRTSNEGVPGPKRFKSFITGYPVSVTYSTNGRVEEPDEITNLVVLLMDNDHNLVFQQRIFNDYNYAAEPIDIPDTAFLPALDPGLYTVIVATVDVWYDMYENRLWGPESWTISSGPIFIGIREFELTEDGQEVIVDMKHLSSRVTVKLAEGSEVDHEFIHLNFESDENKTFEILYDDSLIVRENIESHDSYSAFGVGLGKEYYWDGNEEQVLFQTERTVYVMPRTIHRLTLDYGNHDGSIWANQSMEFNPEVDIKTGDAITFMVNVNALAENSIGGVINLEEITWNDLGEVPVP